MKLMLLGLSIALLGCCPVYAEFNSYFISPSDADVDYYCEFKFPVGQIKGSVTSATLFVTPAALPILDYSVNLSGGESTTPLLGNISTWTDIGKGYIRNNILFHELIDFDVTDFIRSVKSPYVEIHLDTYLDLFNRDAQLRVETFVPEPSSFGLLAIGVGALLIASRCPGGRPRGAGGGR